MACVVTQGASKATPTKSNRKHILPGKSKRNDEIECEAVKKIKTTQDPSTSASSISFRDGAMIEWVVGNVNVTQKFCKYQQRFIDKAMNYGLKWNDSYELVIDRASIPLIESDFCHFVALEGRINKLAEDFKRRNKPFMPPLQMKFD
ncbi:11850_t:CDS:2 [Acaulospora morrowiae]|uniref:11850_t:CDS:1 n=1 Tax=Acaulospora morrowiae TaxID=94023 RepID=A0A9N8W0X9_9GLOM|nr:11850_t:CDS:2 [Acaulospora morrowiae]